MTEETYPYAPEGATQIGKPPVQGAGGERGSSAFTGNDEFNADGTPKSDVPETGPALGASYYEAQHPRPVDGGAQGSTREPATASGE